MLVCLIFINSSGLKRCSFKNKRNLQDSSFETSIPTYTALMWCLDYGDFVLQQTRTKTLKKWARYSEWLPCKEKMQTFPITNSRKKLISVLKNFSEWYCVNEIILNIFPFHLFQLLFSHRCVALWVYLSQSSYAVTLAHRKWNSVLT